MRGLRTPAAKCAPDSPPPPVASSVVYRRLLPPAYRCELHHLLELLTFPDHPELFASELQQKTVAIVLHNIVREQCLSDEFTLGDLKKWMVDAHKKCVNMGRTLADANAIVTHLDILISVIIVLAVVLTWLLITGVATTTVLVAITPPFLAFTFIKNW